MERCLEETLRLKTVIQLLESEIELKNKELTKLRKNDVSQKSEIKKLSILIDYQKHVLPKHIVTGRDVPDHDNSSSSSNACRNNSTEVPVSVNRRRRRSTKVVSSRKFSESVSKSVIDSDASRSQFDIPVEPSPNAPTCPQVAVIGSSIVRGVNLGFKKRGVDALTFIYPVWQVPQITKRISSILTKAYLAPVLLSIFRSNSKFDENSKHSSVTYTRPITTIFCTHHDSVTVVTCAKYRCDRSNIFETRPLWIFIEFRIRSKYA